MIFEESLKRIWIINKFDGNQCGRVWNLLEYDKILKEKLTEHVASLHSLAMLF